MGERSTRLEGRDHHNALEILEYSVLITVILQPCLSLCTGLVGSGPSSSDKSYGVHAGFVEMNTQHILALGQVGEHLLIP